MCVAAEMLALVAPDRKDEAVGQVLAMDLTHASLQATPTTRTSAEQRWPQQQQAQEVMRVSLCYAMSRAGTTTTDAMAQQQQAQQQQAQQQQASAHELALVAGVHGRAQAPRQPRRRRGGGRFQGARARSPCARDVLPARHGDVRRVRYATCEALLPRLGGWSCEAARQLQRDQLRSSETCTGAE